MEQLRALGVKADGTPAPHVGTPSGTRLAVSIRPLGATELATLARCLASEPPDKHSQRYAKQRAGSLTYLVAWDGDVPLGHAVLHWGVQAPIAGLEALGPHPYIADVLVAEQARSRGVGSQLLDVAERLAGTAGCAVTALAVGVDNVCARGFYGRRGYRPVGYASYIESGIATDAAGQERLWCERCLYLVKHLETGR